MPSLIIGAIAASTVFATAYQWHSNRAPEMILIEEIDKYERGLFFRRMKSEKMDESTYETISSAMEFVTLRCNDSKDGGVEEAKIVLEATFSDRQNPEGIVKYVFGK